MPRSYSYDHFQVPKKETNLIHDHEKTHYTESAPATGEPKIHYGKAHSETEQLLAARRMNVELEKLAAEDEAKDRAAAEKKAAKKDKKSAKARKATAELPDVKVEPQRSAPIGAVPKADEFPMAQDELRDLLETARGHTRLVRLALRDLLVATYRLALLPLEAAQLARRSLRHRTA